jgi:hypothetical protein
MSEAFDFRQHTASELRRMLARQKELDPSSMEYGVLMKNLEVLVNTVDLYSDIETFLGMVDAGIESIEIAPGGKEVIEAETPASTPDEAEDNIATAAHSAPTEATSPTTGKTYEMSEVRAALVDARRKGTNVTELLKEFGVENFSAFPAGRYGELMQRLGAA